MANVEAPIFVIEEIREAEKKNKSEPLQKENAPLVNERLSELAHKLIPQESIKRKDDKGRPLDSHHLRLDIEFPIEIGGVNTEIFISRGKYPFDDVESQIEESFALKFGSNPQVHIINANTLLKNGSGYEREDLESLNEVLDYLGQVVEAGEIVPNIKSPI